MASLEVSGDAGAVFGRPQPPTDTGAAALRQQDISNIDEQRGVEPRQPGNAVFTIVIARDFERIPLTLPYAFCTFQARPRS